MCCIEVGGVLCQAFEMLVLLAAAGAHVTERSFTRVYHANMEELNSNAHQNFSVHSLATCSTLCSQNVDCWSYAWTNHVSHCTLLSKDGRRDSLNPLIPPDIAVYTKLYSNCSEFGYEAITGMIGHCYKAYTELKSYSETQSICKNDGGNLVRIPTSTKHAAILQFVNLKSNKEIYIDGSNIPYGSWRLSDGSPMFLNWRSGEPTGDAGENCVIMFDDGTYNDVYCTAMIPFICERQLNV